MDFIEKSPLEIVQIRFLDTYMVGHDGFIAGGCFKNIFNQEKMKDIDIFFKSEDHFDEAVKYYEDHDDYEFSYENMNTKAFLNTKTKVRVELIRNTYGEPEEILKKFDFSITKFAYIKVENQEGGYEYKCLYHPLFFEHLHLKKLVLEKPLVLPVSTFERSYRYTRYGYGLCKESKAILIEELQNANTNDLSNALYFGLD